MTFNEMVPYIILAAAILLVIAAIMFFRTSTTKVTGVENTGDVLDEGGAKPVRNQALIDAPRSVAQDVGQTSANANSDKIAAAPAQADAEAGVSVAPTVGDPVPPPPAETAPEPEAELPPIGGGDDDLTRIKGLGPKLATMLREQGITSYAQIAAWSDADVERVDATLGRFKGRITRDQWVEQAKLLSSGDGNAFDERFGRNT